MAEAMADSEALEANQPPVDASPAALEPDATDVEVAVARPDGDAGTAEAEAPTQVALFGSDEAPSEAPTAVAETTETTDATVASPVAVASPAYCPYCATILEPPPTADRRCGQCRQKIVVRHVGTRTVLLAEAALPVFEAERRRAAEAERWGRLRDKWLELARWAGAPDDKVARLAAEPPAEAKAIAARTLYNAAVDRSFEAAMRTGKLEQAGRIRFDQAAVLFGFAGSAVPPPPTDPGSGKTATDRPGRRSAPSRSTRRGG
jgi:hypothetical protein